MQRSTQQLRPCRKSVSCQSERHSYLFIVLQLHTDQNHSWIILGKMKSRAHLHSNHHQAYPRRLANDGNRVATTPMSSRAHGKEGTYPRALDARICLKDGCCFWIRRILLRSLTVQRLNHSLRGHLAANQGLERHLARCWVRRRSNGRQSS